MFSVLLNKNWFEMLRIFLIFLCLNSVICLLEWMFPSNGDDEQKFAQKEKNMNSKDAELGLMKIPFEIESAEQKFLQEAKHYTDVNFKELDICQQKLILHLKSSCATMSEEDLSKLSVNLLNCQSAAEGRKTYACTDSMSLHACTKEMDQSTWNAYLIISNRARSVCFSIRQQHFRISAEMTVNKLVTTAEEQLIALLSLKDGQEKLSQLTENTLETVSSKHKDLIQQQMSLKHAQDSIQGQISNNFRILVREKALIAAGQKEIAEMMEEINKKLQIAEKELSLQESKRHQNFHLVLNDLSRIQEKYAAIWNKIDNSTNHILTQHSLALKQYELSLANLEKINGSINYLLDLIVTTKSEVDEKLAWLAGLAGGAGVQLSLITTCVLHLIYLLLGALAVVFLQAPRLTRISLLVVVPCNALFAVHYGKSFDVISMIILIAAVTSGPFIFKLSRALYQYDLKMLDQIITYVKFRLNKQHNFLNAILNKRDESESYYSNKKEAFPPLDCSRLDARITDTSMTMLPPYLESNLNTSLTENSLSEGIRKRLSQNENEHTSFLRFTPSPTSSRSSTPLRSGHSNRKPCEAINKRGHRCRLSCLEGELYCHVHKDS